MSASNSKQVAGEEENVEVSGTVLERMRAMAPMVKNGTYTVTNTERGEHYTLKLHTAQRGNLAGKRIISMLVGPNNEADFQGVAFWDDAKGRAYIWGKHRGTDSVLPLDGNHWQEWPRWSRHEQKVTIFLDLAIRIPLGHSHWRTRGYTLLCEGRCCVCNRKLTTPESIEYGIGPVCAQRAS